MDLGQRSAQRLASLALAFASLLALATGPGLAGQASGAEPLPVLACVDDPDPYLATSNFVIGRQFESEPAIVAFRRDSDEDSALELAEVRDVGAIYGLAYDAARERLYAGAFHKRNSHHGPSGPGAVLSCAA